MAIAQALFLDISSLPKHFGLLTVGLNQVRQLNSNPIQTLLLSTDQTELNEGVQCIFVN